MAASPFTWVAAWPSLLWTGAAIVSLAAVAWALFAALQDRNPALHMSGDRYLLLLLMWCILCPLGHACPSVPRRRE